MSDSILITGGDGFLGKALALSAIAAGLKVRVSVRKKSKELDSCPPLFLISNLDSSTEWGAALAGVKTIVHCAARVHVINERSHDPLMLYRKVNVDGTLNLAHQAVLAGVKRFIFISSIKVNGEGTDPGKAFTEGDIPNPADYYAQSKYEAELGLRKISLETGMEIVIIRPPLIYGPGVKANFLSMIKMLQKSIPLPFGGITNNRRSFVFIGNLVDMILTCINHPAAASQVFLVSDGEDLSTARLLEKMSLALDRPPKLIAVPVFLIKLMTWLVGRSDIFKRLCGSLQVDIRKSRCKLGWSPPIGVDEGLRQTAAYFFDIHP